MGNPVLNIGGSGSGKSTGIRNLDRHIAAIFNVAGKPFPFRGMFDMVCTTSNVDDIISILKYSHHRLITHHQFLPKEI